MDKPVYNYVKLAIFRGYDALLMSPIDPLSAYSDVLKTSYVAYQTILTTIKTTMYYVYREYYI